MAELKTQVNDASVIAFIDSVEHATRRKDALQLLNLFAAITQQPAKMWGTAIIGFGSYHYRYASGREGDWMRTGFSPRKSNLSLYIMNGFKQYDELLKQLGKHKIGKSCLYINKLANIDLDILKEMIRHSYHQVAMGEKPE